MNKFTGILNMYSLHVLYSVCAYAPHKACNNILDILLQILNVCSLKSHNVSLYLNLAELTVMNVLNVFVPLTFITMSKN